MKGRYEIMKKMLSLICAAIMLLTLAIGVAEAPAFTTIEPGKLIISTSPDFPPFEYTDDEGNIIGIEPDLIALICEKLGLELEILPMDFDSALLAAQTGKTDAVVSGVTCNGEVGEARRLIFDFTVPYASITQAIVCKEGAEITMENLGSKVIGVQRGTTGEIYVSEDFGEKNVIAYDTYSLVFQALKNGQVDCIVMDDTVAKAYVASMLDMKLVIAPTTYEPEDFAFGIFKKDTGLCDAISAALQELIDDGTVNQIILKYNSEEE